MKNQRLLPLQGKKEKKVQVGSKTKMEGFECPTKLKAGRVFPSMDAIAKTKLQLKYLLQKEKRKLAKPLLSKFKKPSNIGGFFCDQKFQEI